MNNLAVALEPDDMAPSSQLKELMTRLKTKGVIKNRKLSFLTKNIFLRLIELEHQKLNLYAGQNHD